MARSSSSSASRAMTVSLKTSTTGSGGAGVDEDEGEEGEEEECRSLTISIDPSSLSHVEPVVEESSLGLGPPCLELDRLSRPGDGLIVGRDSCLFGGSSSGRVRARLVAWR